MEPAIADSARKHGIADEDLLHAYHNPIRFYEMDEGLVIAIGADRSGGLIEVGVSMRGDQRRIVHGMPARLKFLR